MAEKKESVKKRKARGFVTFLREQGVMGLAIGFILGQGAKDVVTSFVEDILEPILGVILGTARGLDAAAFQFFGATISYGKFLTIVIDFFIVAALVYFVFKGLKLDKLDLSKKS